MTGKDAIYIGRALCQAHEDMSAEAKAESCPVCYAANYLADMLEENVQAFDRRLFLAITRGESRPA
jgi:hypothetical protein